MADQPDRKSVQKAKAEKPWQRSYRTQTLADAALPILRAVLGRQGFTAVEIAVNWPLIVGERIARYSGPIKLTRPRFEGHEGVLHIQAVSGGFALELQHQEPQILERVNGYFGYRAAGKLRITQGPLPERPASSAVPLSAPALPLPPEQQLSLDTALENIQNPALRAALAELGKRVLQENKKKE